MQGSTGDSYYYSQKVTQLRTHVGEELTVISSLEQFREDFLYQKICNCPCEQLSNLRALQNEYDAKFFEDFYLVAIPVTRSSGWRFTVDMVHPNGDIRILQQPTPTADVQHYHIIIGLYGFTPERFNVIFD